MHKHSGHTCDRANGCEESETGNKAKENVHDGHDRRVEDEVFAEITETWDLMYDACAETKIGGLDQTIALVRMLPKRIDDVRNGIGPNFESIKRRKVCWDKEVVQAWRIFVLIGDTWKFKISNAIHNW